MKYACTCICTGSKKIEKNVSIIVYVNIYYEKNTTAVDVMAKIRLVSIAIKLKLLPL